MIAQLGKNYSLPKEKQIAGSILLGFALETISNLKYSVGGVMEFLEREDNEFLLNFYTRNHFKPFDMRTTVHTCRFTTLFLAKLISFGTERQFVKRDTRNQKLIASGAHSSAIIYSIAETATANNLNPYDYFVYLLEETPKHMDNTDHSFLMICYHGHQIYLTEFTRTDTQGCHEAALNFL